MPLLSPGLYEVLPSCSSLVCLYYKLIAQDGVKLCFQRLPLETVTCWWVGGDAVVLAVTHPLPAAAPRRSHQLRIGALLSGFLQIVTAEGHAGQPSPEAAAQLGAGGLEHLPFLQPPAVYLAAQLVLACAQQTQGSLCQYGNMCRWMMSRNRLIMSFYYACIRN